MTNTQPGKRKEYLFFGTLLIVCLILAFARYFTTAPSSDSFRISSDKAQYYVYLPATFIYGWDVKKFPMGSEKERHGFVLDQQKNKVITKTTCGVAILWAPFFLATHLLASALDLQPDGFSWMYERMTVVAGVVYLLLGLFFLRRFLSCYYSRLISYVTVIFLFLGTNLYFYGMEDGLMSHINSFFLFSLYLFLLKKFLDSGKRSMRLFLMISIVVSLTILIRPTNILLLTWMIFLDAASWKDIRERTLLFLQPKYLFTFFIICFLIFIPQLFYWKYLTGKFIYYSYPGETFSNWNNPRLLSFWFAPLNGLFLYSPLVLMFIAGVVAMIRKKAPNGIFIASMFLLVSYIFASWYCWFFGGSFGSRPMVEFYALLALPFGYFLTLVSRMKNLYIRSLCIIFIVSSSYYSLALTYNNYWNTFSTWSWDDFLLRLDRAGLYHFTHRSYTYINDFENPALTKIYPTSERFRSPTVAGFVNSWVERNAAYSRELGTVLFRPVKKVTTRLWVNQPEGIATGAFFSCNILDENRNVQFSRVIRFDDFILQPDTWTRVDEIMLIPTGIDMKDTITFEVVNPLCKATLFIDDISIKFE